MRTRAPTRFQFIVGSAVASVCAGSIACAAEYPPRGFVYLKDIDKTIIQEMRYHTNHNFVGRRIDGYEAGECILTKRAALALHRVQASLKKQSLSLKVYDCYRPMRAVRHFVRWAREPRDEATKREFYPTLDKSKLFRLGYISSRSSHARGSAVDLTIVAVPAAAQPRFDVNKQTPCYYSKDRRFADNSLDFGTGYDCFHVWSHTRSNGVPRSASENRTLLASEMAKAGFSNYRKEWWHFQLRDEPFSKTQFDFPILARAPEARRTEPRAPMPETTRSLAPIGPTKPAARTAK